MCIIILITFLISILIIIWLSCELNKIKKQNNEFINQINKNIKFLDKSQKQIKYLYNELKKLKGTNNE